MEKLRTALGVICLGCGAVNLSGEKICTKCDAVLPSRDRAVFYPMLDSTPGAPSFKSILDFLKNVPLEESDNLARLAYSVGAVEAKKIPFRVYFSNVTNIYKIVLDVLYFLNRKRVWDTVAKINDYYRRQMIRLVVLFLRFHDGCLKMMEYDGGKDVSPARKGLAMVMEAVAEINRVESLLFEAA